MKFDSKNLPFKMNTHAIRKTFSNDTIQNLLFISKIRNYYHKILLQISLVFEIEN